MVQSVEVMLHLATVSSLLIQIGEPFSKCFTLTQRLSFTFFSTDHSFNQTLWDRLVEDANTYGGGLFNQEAFKHNAKRNIETSRATNPEYTNGANFFVNYATRALTFRPLPNGTAPDVADYKNIAPF